MAKGKDFRGGLNTLLKKTEPTKKEVPIPKITKSVEEKTKPKKARKTIPVAPKKVAAKKPVEVITKLASTKDVKKESTIDSEERRKKGRPKTNNRVITKSSQRGTKEGETRATFIVKEEYLEKFKALAYLNRKSLKKIINTAMLQYLDAQADEIVEKAIKSFREKE